MVTAIITLTNVDGVEDTDTAFVAVYSLLFALLLSVYECSHCGCWYEEIEERCGGFYRKVSKMIDCLFNLKLCIAHLHDQNKLHRLLLVTEFWLLVFGHFSRPLLNIHCPTAVRYGGRPRI